MRHDELNSHASAVFFLPVDSSYLHAQTQQPISGAEAKASHHAGRGYGVLIHAGPGSIRVIPMVTAVWIRFFDGSGRVVWALTWGRRNDEDLRIINFSGTGYFKDGEGEPHERELWTTMILPRTDGTWGIRHSNPSAWKSVESEVESEVSRLPYPDFSAFGDYLDFDYSGFENVAQDFPPRLFPHGHPDRAPSIKEWTASIR